MKFNKTKRPKIKSRLIKYLVFFTAFSIIVVWLFQTFFLEDFYRSIKANELNNSVKLIAKTPHNKYEALLNKLKNNDICVLIYDSNLVRIASAHAGSTCLIHSVPERYIYELLEKTLEGDGSYSAYYYSSDSSWSRKNFVRHTERNLFNDIFFDIFGSFFPQETKSFSDEDSMLGCLTATDPDGNDIFIIVSTVIVPVDATVRTLRVQLAIITIALILLAILVAIFISKKVTSPIVSLTEESKKLVSNRFRYEPSKNGYKEIDELGNTLQYANDEMAKVDSLRRELIANVSHDLRTPLTLITGYSEMMRDIPSEVTPENLQTIIDESKRLSDLVSDLLDISKVEAGMQTLSRSTFCFTETLEEIMKRYQTLIDKKVCDIVFESDATVYANADRTKLIQVIYNLINNAVNYAGQDKKVIVKQTVSDGKIRLEVIDHGVGIPAEELPHIWDRYYRVKCNHERAAVGSGLGLSIVKKLLDLHGAKYGVESNPGEGSNFWFEIPLAKAPEELTRATLEDEQNNEEE